MKYYMPSFADLRKLAVSALAMVALGLTLGVTDPRTPLGPSTV